MDKLLRQLKKYKAKLSFTKSPIETFTYDWDLKSNGQLDITRNI